MSVSIPAKIVAFNFTQIPMRNVLRKFFSTSVLNIWIDWFGNQSRRGQQGIPNRLGVELLHCVLATETITVIRNVVKLCPNSPKRNDAEKENKYFEPFTRC